MLAPHDIERKRAGPEAVCPEIPLPGLPGAAAQIAGPLAAYGRVIGVLAVESTDPLAFMPREDTLLTIVAAQLAAGIEHLSRDVEESSPAMVTPIKRLHVPDGRRTRHFCFFGSEDCVFVDGEYLIRNVAARTL
jgi:adenylate cyclase